MKRAVVLGLLVLVGWSAQAGDFEPGLRVGLAASFGQFTGNDVPAPELPDRFINDESVGFKLYSQYQFNDWFGVEGAYHYTNDFEGESKSPALPGNLKITFSGYSLQGVLYAPTSIEDFEAYLKAGWYDFDDDLDVNGVDGGSSSERGLVAGAGAIMRFSDRLGLRADFDWFDADVGDLYSVNIGVEYYFGALGQ
jgi:hypothetical protein